MSILDRENRPLLIRLGMVGVLAMGSVGLLAHSIFGNDDDASTKTDKPTRVEVRRVYSGDTIKVSPKNKVIYAGILAPGQHEPLHDESERRNADLVEGKKLRLIFEQQAKDSKGRLHAYAFLDDQFINEMLVREGLAYVRLTTSTRRFADRLLAAQREARDEGVGIWEHVSASTEPNYPADPKYGNYHRPSCEETPKIKPRRRVVLNSKDEAFDAGYAPCRRCLP